MNNKKAKEQQEKEKEQAIRANNFSQKTALSGFKKLFLKHSQIK